MAAAPTPYNSGFSFSGEQNGNPTSKAPGARFDTEYGAIASSIASIIAALADVRRADGKLVNGLITRDAFNAAFLAQLDAVPGIYNTTVAARDAAIAARNSATASATSATQSLGAANLVLQATRDVRDATILVKNATDLLVVDAEEIRDETQAIKVSTIAAVNGAAAKAATDAAAMFTASFRNLENSAKYYAKVSTDAAQVSAENTAERFRALFENDRNRAERAAFNAQAYTQSAVSQGSVPIYGNELSFATMAIPAGLVVVEVTGYSTLGKGRKIFRRVATEPTHPGKVRTADRWNASGLADPANGGWWEDAGIVVQVDAYGAKGDGVTDDTAAIQKARSAARGGVVEFDPRGRYLVNGTTLVSDLSEELRGNGCTVIQGGDAIVFDWRGGYDAAQVVSAQAAVDVIVATRARKTTRLTVPNAAAFAVDDVVKVYADDVIPSSPHLSRKLGQFAIVAQIDTANNYVYLNARLRDVLVTNVRIAKSKKTRLVASGFNFTTELANGSGNGDNAYMRILGGIDNVVERVNVEKSQSNAILFQSCFGYTASQITGNGLRDKDDETEGFGYLICDANSEMGQVSHITGKAMRHLFTTNTYSLNDGLPHSFGRSEFAVVSDCVSIGSANAPFDTHGEARNIRFVDCIHYGGGFRSTAIDGGATSFQSRSDFTDFVDCKAYGSHSGFLVLCDANRQDGGQRVKLNRFVNCEVPDAAYRALRVQTGELEIEGGVYGSAPDCENQPLAYFYAAAVTMTGVTLKPIGKHASKTVVQPDASDLTMFDCVLDLRGKNLDDQGRLLNYNPVFISLANSPAAQSIFVQDLKILSAVPMSVLVGAYANTAPGVVTQLENITITNFGTTVLCADGATKTIGLAGASITAIFGGSFLDYTKTSIANLVERVAGSTKQKRRSKFIEEFSASTGDMTLALRGRNDDEIFLRLTPAGPISLTNWPVGQFDGQTVTIQNASNVAANLISMLHGTSGQFVFCSNGYGKSLLYRESVTFVWDRQFWVEKDNAQVSGSMTWDRPARFQSGVRLWFTATGGVMRTKQGSDPISDTDGTAIGTQT